jgi:hypothetical protein
MRCSKSSFVAGDDCAAASRESTIPPKKRSGPSGVTRPNSEFAPRAIAPGEADGDAAPRPANAKCPSPPAPSIRDPSPR